MASFGFMAGMELIDNGHASPPKAADHFRNILGLESDATASAQENPRLEKRRGLEGRRSDAIVSRESHDINCGNPTSSQQISQVGGLAFVIEKRAVRIDILVGTLSPDEINSV